MSYDIWLAIDTGGAEPACVGELLNYTSNVSGMWRLALKDTSIPSVGEMDGRLAADCMEPLETAIQRMRANPEPYEAMNPPNGWGDAEGARKFLGSLLALCRAHPKATVRVSR